MRMAVLVVGALHLATGVLMALAPRGFYDNVGTFPPFNAHYLRDLSTFYVALGVALVISARRRSWQVPLLTLAVLQYALHVLNHFVDIGDADPGWKGPVTVVALILAGVVLWSMLRSASREQA